MKRVVGRSLLLGLVWLGGCAHVDPKPDYARVAQVVEQRTSVADIYDPADEALVADRVSGLLRPTLTIENAVRIALLNNPGFQAGFATLGASRADVVQSTLLTNPSLTFGFEFPDGGGRSKIIASWAQQVADLWQIPVRKKIAEAELERTLLATARRGIDLVAETKTRCYRLLALQQSEKVLREARALAEQSLHVAQAQLEAGEVSQFDLSLVRAALVDVDLELLTLERDRRAAEIDLARSLGLTRMPPTWTLSDDLPGTQSTLADDADLIAAALDQRLDARAALLAVGAAENELIRQHLRIFPDLTLGADFERPDQRTLPGRKIIADTIRSSLAAGKLTAPAIQSRGERRIETSQIVNSLLGPSLSVTLPLWDQNQAQIAKARYMVVQRRKELEELLDTVAAEVLQAASAARNAQSLVQVYEQQALPQAQENVAGALRLYETGEQSMLVVLDSQESLLRRRRSYIDARRDYAVARATLEQALAGRLAALPAGAPDSSAPEEPH